jgi:hypothetical protein
MVFKPACCGGLLSFSARRKGGSTSDVQSGVENPEHHQDIAENDDRERDVNSAPVLWQQSQVQK